MKLVAVTSCTTGVAHTYMAAEAIKKGCKKRNIECKVETQGALGIENKLKPAEIKDADVIVFCNDVKIMQLDRFDGYDNKIIKVKAHDVVKNVDVIFERIETK